MKKIFLLFLISSSTILPVRHPQTSRRHPETSRKIRKNLLEKKEEQLEIECSIMTAIIAIGLAFALPYLNSSYKSNCLERKTL
jgi:hypothetical protein